MLLPELTISISIEYFETNFEHFFYKYASKHNLPHLTLKKSDIVSSGYRYTILFDTEESSGSAPTMVGEIDVIPIHEEKLKFQAAVYNFVKLLKPLLFFNEFFNLVFANWEVDPRDRIHGYEDELATSEWIDIGWDSGYFYLPDVIQDMSKLLEDNFGYSLSENLAFHKDVVPSFTNSEREEIVKKYQFEINKGLTKIYRSNEQSGNTGDSSIIGNTYETIEEVPQQETNPWDQIAEGETLQKMVRYIHEGLPPYKIAYELGYETSTVYNRSSELRKKYGKKIVPYFQDWRNIED